MLYHPKTIMTTLLAVFAIAAALSGCDGEKNEMEGMSDTTIRIPAGEERVMPVDEDSADIAWKEFWQEFRAAVQQHDSAAMRAMMRGRFGYGNTLEATPEYVFQELAYAGGENWKVLEQTVDLETKPYDLPSSSRPARVAINPDPCGHPPCRYQAWAIFEKGEDEQWRWIALIFPGD